jgi:hypothetical protein
MRRITKVPLQVPIPTLLTFLPTFAVGPILEPFLMNAGKVFLRSSNSVLARRFQPTLSVLYRRSKNYLLDSRGGVSLMRVSQLAPFV